MADPATLSLCSKRDITQGRRSTRHEVPSFQPLDDDMSRSKWESLCFGKMQDEVNMNPSEYGL